MPGPKIPRGIKDYWDMLPKPIQDRIKREAARKGIELSAFVISYVRRRLRGRQKETDMSRRFTRPTNPDPAATPAAPATPPTEAPRYITRDEVEQMFRELTADLATAFREEGIDRATQVEALQNQIDALRVELATLKEQINPSPAPERRQFIPATPGLAPWGSPEQPRVDVPFTRRPEAPVRISDDQLSTYTQEDALALDEADWQRWQELRANRLRNANRFPRGVEETPREPVREDAAPAERPKPKRGFWDSVKQNARERVQQPDSE